MTDLGICMGCGAPILWARSAKTGKPMALDREPVVDGTVRLGRDGDALVLREGERITPSVFANLYLERYRPHSSTCSRGSATGRRREEAA